jgi:hypothetical protein
VRAPRTVKLLVDEIGDASFLCTGSEIVGGNQAAHRGFDEGRLRLREVAVRLQQGRSLRAVFRVRGMVRMLGMGVRRDAGDRQADRGQGGDGFEKAASAR